MAVSTQSSDQRTQIIVEFKARIQSSRDEIQTRYSLFNDQLKEDELRLLTKLDDIERDTIDKFNGSSASLPEILLARENILGILKSNTTSTLLKNHLEMYDKEIEEITTKSVIKSTNIELNWKIDKLGTICEMNEIVYQNFKTTFPQQKDDSTSGSISPIVEDHIETIRPAVKDETARVLKELERIISEDSKQARDIVKTEYTELKRKVTESKNEKIEFIDQLESEKKAKISSLTTTYNGLRIAQDCSKKDDIDIIQKFLVLEKDLNRIRNSIMSQKINTEFHKDELSDSLKLFCVLNYGLPPGTQAIPPHNAPIEKPLQQQPADLPEKGDQSIDDFIRFVHTFKTLDFKPTLYSEIPIEIVNQSKQYVKYMNKYTLVKSYEIMRSSIQNGKLMNNVCTGFENLSKLANCIYFDPNSKETRIIQVDSVFYQDISNNLCNTDDVFQLLGYENKRQFWQLDNVSVSKFEARIERVFCELCLAVQESNAVEKQVPTSGRLDFFTQMVEKSAKPGLPLPSSRPKPKEQEAAQAPENY